MSSTGTKDDRLPLIASISGLTTRQPPLTRVTQLTQHGTKSSSASDSVRKNLNLLKRCGCLQLFIGLFSFCLGLILSLSLALWPDANVNFPHWAGGLLFFGLGVVSLLAGIYPRPRLMLLNVILNLVAPVFAVTILYLHIFYYLTTEFRPCGRPGWLNPVHTTEPPDVSQLREGCELAQQMSQTLLKHISFALICFTSAQFGNSFSVIIIGIRFWRSFETTSNQSPKAPQQHTPVTPGLTTVTIVTAERPLVLFRPKTNDGENGTDLKANASENSPS